jgi:hypothetical protein
VWRTDNANLPAAQLFASQTGQDLGRTSCTAAQGADATAGWKRLTCDIRGTPGYNTFNFCTGQCWYDQEVFTPKGLPDRVYVLGSYQYGEAGNISNGRGVVFSTNAGDPDPSIKGGTFSDLTWDSTPDLSPDGIHPDQHTIVINPDEPDMFFEGSDGGIMRSDGKYVDESYLCAKRTEVDATSGQEVELPAVDPPGFVNCQQHLSRVPHQLFDTLNKKLLTLQFQSISVNPDRPLDNVQGGTQDNGTFEWNSSVHIWDQVMYGDGGISGYDPVDTKIRFNSFAGPSTDSNFHGGQPQWWVVTGGKLHSPQNGNEFEPFYMSLLQDPVVAGHRFAGLDHVWRTDDNGGPEAYLEATCPEFTTSEDDPRCGDYVPLGGPAGPNQPGDVTGSAYGADKTAVTSTGVFPAGSVISFFARCRGDASTMWVGTDLGRVLISRNINAAPSAVTFTRVDTAAQPGRYVSGIAVDPKNCNRAWVTFSGYNQNTPATPGHVFEVTAAPAGPGGVWRDLAIETATAGFGGPALNIPVTDIARDDLTGDLYAATDFGVLKNPGVPQAGGFTNASGAWTLAGPGMPFVEVPSLTIIPEARVLYAGTHGRSAYRMLLPGKSTANNNTPGQEAP